MKVICEIIYLTIVEVEVPDGLPDEEARTKAILAVDATSPKQNAEWDHSTYYKHPNVNEEWFDLP